MTNSSDFWFAIRGDEQGATDSNASPLGTFAIVTFCMRDSGIRRI